jgi:hypothetical protein
MIIIIRAPFQQTATLVLSTLVRENFAGLQEGGERVHIASS